MVENAKEIVHVKKRAARGDKTREEILREILKSQSPSPFLRRSRKEPIEYVRTKLRAGVAD